MTPKTCQIQPISLELPKNSFQIINQKKKISAPQMCKITQSPSVKAKKTPEHAIPGSNLGRGPRLGSQVAGPCSRLEVQGPGSHPPTL